MTERFTRRSASAKAGIWSRAACAYSVLLALGLAYFIFRMPYQLSDDLEHLLLMQFQSVRDLIVDSFSGDQSLRPVMWLQQKVLFTIAPAGRYFATYKAFNAAQLVLVAVLFVRLLRVRTVIDFVAVPLALAVLVGLHTFNVAMREGYPTNHFMTVLVCCLVVTSLAMSRPRWWHDVVAVLLFAYAALTIETGLLVWVCIVTGYVAGWRGISGKGAAAATAALAGYFVLRFFVLDIGSRTLTSMSSGYGFSVRSTGELTDLFGDAPWKFYLYNVVCAGLTVLFSEPRAGVFQFTAFVARGDVPMWSIVNVAVSTIGTVLIGLYAIRRVREWRRRPLEHEDRVLLLFAAVLGANAVMSYPYLKEVVMSPAGMFYAAALFLAVRDLLGRISPRPPAAVARALIVASLVILSAGWTLRAVTLVASMRATAFVNRSDWAVAEEFEDRNRRNWRTRHPGAQALFNQLRDEVIRTRVPQPYTVPRWTREWLDPY